jgi:putative transposase
MAAEGMAVQVACKVLGVSESGFYEHRKRPPSERSIRHAMLTDLITQIHVESHGIYGGRRVHAELTLGRGVVVGHNQVQLLMRRAGLGGITGRVGGSGSCPTTSPPTGSSGSSIVPDRTSSGSPTSPSTPTREGKVYCCVILDTYSRRVVGWSIDSSPTGALVTNALGMAIDSRLDRSVEPGTIIHSDQGVQFGFWALTKRAKDSGLLASMGSIGDCYDNSMIEAFWSRMQVELLDRKKWNTRLELANAIFEYLEIWHNRKRRHSKLGWLTPIEFERNRIITVA